MNSNSKFIFILPTSRHKVIEFKQQQKIYGQYILEQSFNLNDSIILSHFRSTYFFIDKLSTSEPVSEPAVHSFSQREFNNFILIHFKTTNNSKVHFLFSYHSHKITNQSIKTPYLAHFFFCSNLIEEQPKNVYRFQKVSKYNYRSKIFAECLLERLMKQKNEHKMRRREKETAN